MQPWVAKSLSESNLNEFLVWLFSSKDESTASDAMRNWKGTLHSHFNLTATQKRAVAGLSSDDDRIIERTLKESLATRSDPQPTLMQVRFVSADRQPPRNGQVSVARGRRVDGALHFDSPDQATEIEPALFGPGFVWGAIVVLMFIGECYGLHEP